MIFLRKWQPKIINKFKGYNPILAILTGVIITFACVGFLELIAGTYINNSTNFYGLINNIVGATAFLIGGFTTLFFAKEKNIEYGIYTGIISVTVSLLCHLYGNLLWSTSIIIPETYYVFFGMITGYILAATAGGYLGTILNKHLKITTKTEP